MRAGPMIFDMGRERAFLSMNQLRAGEGGGRENVQLLFHCACTDKIPALQLTRRVLAEVAISCMSWHRGS